LPWPVIRVVIFRDGSKAISTQGDAMSSARATVVILPGLDGTGTLLTEFKNALSLHFDVQVITYPTLEPLSYAQLLEYVEERLPARHFILIGESFSGPLALRVSEQKPAGMQGLVLGASFARLGVDGPLKAALRFAHMTMTPFMGTRFARALTPQLLSPLLLGRWTTPEWRRRLRKMLALVAPRVLAARVGEALAVDLVEAGVKPGHPLLYLRASADRLIPPTAADDVARLSPAVEIKNVEAPHFLFQVAPELCAQAIRDFAIES
jgi:pimeloyl-[acyl-carrier protein] methyl ester esterase